MLDGPELIQPIKYVLSRGGDVVDAEDRNVRIAKRSKHFCIADRVRCSIHKVEQICSAIFSTARKRNSTSSGHLTVTLVWYERIRIDTKDIRNESPATSVTRSASDGNQTLLTRLDEDFAQFTSSTLLGCGKGGGEPVEGDGLAAQRAGAEDDGEEDLQFVQDLVEGHPGAGTFGSVLIMVQNAWARTARVT